MTAQEFIDNLRSCYPVNRQPEGKQLEAFSKWVLRQRLTNTQWEQMYNAITEAFTDFPTIAHCSRVLADFRAPSVNRAKEAIYAWETWVDARGYCFARVIGPATQRTEHEERTYSADSSEAREAWEAGWAQSGNPAPPPAPRFAASSISAGASKQGGSPRNLPVPKESAGVPAERSVGVPENPAQESLSANFWESYGELPPSEVYEGEKWSDL